MSLQRFLQALCLLLFMLALFYTGISMPDWLAVDAIFYLDPLLFLGVLLSLGVLIPGILILLLLLLATLFLGRFFCGYVCPLGSTFDFSRSMFQRLKSRQQYLPPQNWLKLKYAFLLLILISSLLGLNLAHWGSPLAWAGRFYALVILPWLEFIPQQILERSLGLLDFLGLQGPSLQPDPLRYKTLFFLVPFILLLLWLNHKTPRFWCRYICPTGAMLALIGQRPILRRQVSPACTDCKQCIQECPMQAISQDPTQTSFPECITCQKCAKICPECAISFNQARQAAAKEPFLPARRQALQTVGLATAITFLGHRGLYEYWPKDDKGHITPLGLIRPPGAIPETEFLNQCTRCGLCLRVCPTNMLQPAWWEAGFSGVYSPLAVARRGPCEPECNSCGRICPTGAIRSLALPERQWAKMGTAVINRRSCIAWEMDRDCLICDEACPFGAVQLQRVPEQKVAVPFVQENKCTGCGFCEHACPVRSEPSIKVTPMAELRLAKGSYQQEGRRLGLSISREIQKLPGLKPEEPREDELPPGFSE